MTAQEELNKINAYNGKKVQSLSQYLKSLNEHYYVKESEKGYQIIVKNREPIIIGKELFDDINYKQIMKEAIEIGLNTINFCGNHIERIKEVAIDNNIPKEILNDFIEETIEKVDKKWNSYKKEAKIASKEID